MLFPGLLGRIVSICVCGGDHKLAMEASVESGAPRAEMNMSAANDNRH